MAKPTNRNNGQSMGQSQRPPWLAAGWTEGGEHASNPIAGPPDATSEDVRFTAIGGVRRPRLASLYEPERGLGADLAKRPFNRGVPSDWGR